jgi:hypothetical protein
MRQSANGKLAKMFLPIGNMYPQKRLLAIGKVYL